MLTFPILSPSHLPMFYLAASSSFSFSSSSRNCRCAASSSTALRFATSFSSSSLVLPIHGPSKYCFIICLRPFDFFIMSLFLSLERLEFAVPPSLALLHFLLDNPSVVLAPLCKLEYTRPKSLHPPPRASLSCSSLSASSTTPAHLAFLSHGVDSLDPVPPPEFFWLSPPNVLLISPSGRLLHTMFASNCAPTSSPFTRFPILFPLRSFILRAKF